MPPGGEGRPRDGSGSVTKRREPRTPVAATAPELRDPHEIAEEIAPDRPEQICDKVELIRTHPELNGGPYGAAFEAIFQIVLARCDDRMWTETGCVPAKRPELGSSDPIPLPALAVEALAAGWQRFSRGPENPA